MIKCLAERGEVALWELPRGVYMVYDHTRPKMEMFDREEAHHNLMNAKACFDFLTYNKQVLSK